MRHEQIRADAGAPRKIQCGFTEWLNTISVYSMLHTSTAVRTACGADARTSTRK
jgi:hypothetical protein